MRILFYGNQGNQPFRIARWLRQKGLDVKLYLPKNLPHSRSLPEWENPELRNNYPNWIKTYHHSWFNDFFPPRCIRKEAKKYDILFTTGVHHIVSALKIDLPIVFNPRGGDITQLPFFSDLRSELMSFFYRRRISLVSLILTVQEDCIWAARLLGISDKVKFFPVLVDSDQIRLDIDNELLEELEKKYEKYDYVFLNLSRKNLNPSKPDYKGNEKFLKAFKKLTNKNDNVSIKLILGMHGTNVSDFEDTVAALDLDRYCDYVEHLPLPKLHAYLSLSNGIVFDQFGYILKSFGGIGQETLSLGNVLVCSTDTSDNLFKKNYGDNCPLLYAFTVDEIFNQMEKIINLDKTKLDDIRKRSEEWAYKYLHWENRIEELIDILKEVKEDNNRNGKQL